MVTMQMKITAQGRLLMAGGVDHIEEAASEVEASFATTMNTSDPEITVRELQSLEVRVLAAAVPVALTSIVRTKR